MSVHTSKSLAFLVTTPLFPHLHYQLKILYETPRGTKILMGAVYTAYFIHVGQILWDAWFPETLAFHVTYDARALWCLKMTTVVAWQEHFPVIANLTRFVAIVSLEQHRMWACPNSNQTKASQLINPWLDQWPLLYRLAWNFYCIAEFDTSACKTIRSR